MVVPGLMELFIFHGEVFAVSGVGKYQYSIAFIVTTNDAVMADITYRVDVIDDWKIACVEAMNKIKGIVAAALAKCEALAFNFLDEATVAGTMMWNGVAQAG